MARTAEAPSSTGIYILDPHTDIALASELRAAPTAGVVHDLGNLIQIATSAVNLIARDPTVRTTGALEPMIARARMSLERAGALVQVTLGAASGVGEALEFTSLAACLAEVQTLLQVQPGVSLVVEVDPDLPWPRCSRLGLQNAVINLLLNARDALPDGGVISLSATTAFPGAIAPVVVLRVTDNGVGMNADTMARAFEPFFTTKRPGLGGCGLPMVRRFVQEAAGRVEIESAVGRGTTVSLWLPAVRLTPVEAAPST